MLKQLLNLLTGGCKCSVSVQARGSEAESGSLRDLEAFVEYVTKSLVDFPDEIAVATVDGDEGSTIQIRCRKEDIGKIVGKRGKTIMAIRSLVSGAAGRQHRRVSVDVLD